MTPDEQFVARAVWRLYRWMAAFAVAISLALLLWKGARYAGGFAAGAALSLLNFHWMKGAIDALAAHFQPAGTPAAAAPAAAPAPPRGRRTAILVKFLLRYALIVGVGYAIFRTSVLSLAAFLGGLFVFVAGILAEMIYELATGTGPER